MTDHALETLGLAFLSLAAFLSTWYSIVTIGEQIGKAVVDHDRSYETDGEDYETLIGACIIASAPLFAQGDCAMRSVKTIAYARGLFFEATRDDWKRGDE